jgi:agmatinase
MHMPYQLGGTFLGTQAFSGQPMAVIGAGYDGSTSFRPGARFGPSAIRSASLMLTDGVNPRWPVDLNQLLGDAGDLPVNSVNYHSATHVIERAVERFLDNHTHLITLGGDHSISYPLVMAHAKQHGPLALIHFDAHPDTWSSNFDEPCGHGTWLRQCVEQGAIEPSNAVSVGIRCPADLQTAGWLQSQGGTTIPASQAVFEHPKAIADLISQKLGNRPVYLSLDIDVLDPAYAPGTGTPEIGGPSSAWMRSVMDHLLEKDHIQWAGMDMVEVCPAYDSAGITALAAATFVWQYACCQAHKLLSKKVVDN